MDKKENKKMICVVLLSGGIDSTTTLSVAINNEYKVHALTFRYGQKHNREIECAKKIANYYNIPHKIIDVDISWAKSALTNKNIKIPENRKNIGRDIPSTYVPARNIIFLSYALCYAESIDADAIYIGANAIDYSGYPDCRPAFYHAFQNVINTGTKTGVEGKPIKIKTPLIDLHKSDIISMGIQLHVPYELTWSCYKGEIKPCRKCDSCILREKGFNEAGIVDPLELLVSK